jgi:hypothetical protein
MTSQGKKWIVRNQEGNIYGPFDLDRVKTLLLKGVFAGEEQVAMYPAGDWMPMSSEPELYDVVLDVLAQKGNSTSQSAQKDKTKVQNSEQDKSSIKIIAGETKSRKLKSEAAAPTQTSFNPDNKSEKTKSTTHQTDIEMKDQKDLKKEIKKRKLSIIPLLFITLSAFLLYYAFSMNQKGARQPSVSLLLPTQHRRNDQLV